MLVCTMQIPHIWISSKCCAGKLTSGSLSLSVVANAMAPRVVATGLGKDQTPCVLSVLLFASHELSNAHSAPLCGYSSLCMNMCSWAQAPTSVCGFCRSETDQNNQCCPSCALGVLDSFVLELEPSTTCRTGHAERAQLYDSRTALRRLSDLLCERGRCKCNAHPNPSEHPVTASPVVRALQ